MDCPHCNSENVRLCKTKTCLGYDKYRCRDCSSQYNERTGTLFNYIEYPNEIVMLAVHYYYRFKVSLDDVVELMSMRGIYLSHQTIHNWIQVFGADLGLKLREKRRCKAGQKWYVDPMYIKISGHWYYLYRAIDKNGNLVDVYLSETRNQKAAEDFFAQAEKTTGIAPKQITTDKEPALCKAIKRIFSRRTKHRDSKYKNNIVEQSHRVIKSRYKVMKTFKEPFSALIFCTAFEEIKQFFTLKNATRSCKRKRFASKFKEFANLIGV